MSLKSALEKEIRSEIERIGYEIVELQINKHGRKSLIRIFIDQEGGVTISDCTEVNQAVSDFLFRKNLIHRNYRLEVSSPGVDRPLKTKRDFSRQLGKKILLDYNTESGNSQVQGKLEAIDDMIVLRIDDNKLVEIPFSDVQKGKLKLPW